MENDPSSISFTVVGKPIPQGSMNAYPYRKSSGKMGVRMSHTKGKELEEWRENIRSSFNRENIEGFFAKRGEPVSIDMIFQLEPAKSNRDRWPVKKIGDLDKFVRAVNDALTGIAFEDDCQIITLYSNKQFIHDSSARVVINIRKIK